MGYQEVIFQIKRKSDIEKIANIYSEYIDLDIISLLAVFKSKLNYKKIKKGEIYAIYGTERHPGADSLYAYAKTKHRKCLNMDNYYELCCVTGDIKLFEDCSKQLIELSKDILKDFSIKEWDKFFKKIRRKYEN